MGGLVKSVFGSEGSPAPDYTPLANATQETSRISAELGREQLDESRRQYDRNIELTTPIVKAQTDAMRLAYDQGNTNFQNFMREGRPLQQQMRDLAEGNVSSGVRDQMETAADKSVADVSMALDSQRQQTARSLARTGVAPGSGKALALSGMMDIEAAKAKAGAANFGREQAKDKAYARIGDTLNTYMGAASQAPAFYGAGTSAGGSAVNTTMAPGAALLDGNSRGAGTIMNGRQIAQQGLAGILNAQTNVFAADPGSNGWREAGAVAGGAAALFAASDRRLKQNIVLIGMHAPTGLNLYEFDYINGDGTRYQGVMADEVESRFPGAVQYDDLGFASVDYGMLGIEFKEVA